MPAAFSDTRSFLQTTSYGHPGKIKPFSCPSPRKKRQFQRIENAAAQQHVSILKAAIFIFIPIFRSSANNVPYENGSVSAPIKEQKRDTPVNIKPPSGQK
jgi:hypothetical protein